MTNYITENKELEADIKGVGVLLYISTGLTALMAVVIQDPWTFIDVSIIGTLAYCVHSRKSSKAIYGAGIYFLLDTSLAIGLLVLSPMALIFRGIMLYYILSTAYKVYKQKDTEKLIPVVK